ncbi:hypothetical protein C922_02966 [Plasmodium inui San Antonio 1]|uniref:POPLD domain-containing protein n=1 Tax=Plasmodium inui San Antonio 1 TaxID=1237626 RepID=W7A4J3_9APIC|nr:hypothetical protein C922_02966 [Plasmodium inui San Antonio 1]EUD66645.1 hypothetical protein C922_02966 [Plasmodium inui San Antonio 1]
MVTGHSTDPSGAAGAEEDRLQAGRSGDSTRNNTGNNINNNTSNNTGNNINNNTSNNTSNNTGNNTSNNTRNNTSNNTRNNTGNNTGNNTANNPHRNRHGDGGAERAPPSGILKKQSKGQAKTVQLATSPGATPHHMEGKKMAPAAAYEREEEDIYKTVYEVTQNAEPNFFNCDTVPWVSSFFSLKEEDFTIFGNTLKKRNIFKRCFQRIHKNRRRRCMSFNPYRVPLACKKEKSETLAEDKQNGNNKQEDRERDLWIFVHPLCLQQVMQILQNINGAVKIRHVKNICMYELIGPKSLPLLLNILKIKSKYTVQDEGDLYRFDYENVTLPYDFVIPLYALLPKTIGPFLLNYKISDCEAQKWGEGQNGQRNEECANEKGTIERGFHVSGAPNGKAREPLVRRPSPNDNDIDLAENALDYLRKKNGTATLKASSFSPYDNNILMNERIKQNVIKNIKVNKYEHVRSKKKKKVKTCILKMLQKNKNIQSYDVLREKRSSGVALGDMYRLDGDAPSPRASRNRKRRWQAQPGQGQQQEQPQQGQGQAQEQPLQTRPPHGQFPGQSPTHDENEIQKYIEDFLHKSENEKKNAEQTKKTKGQEASAIYTELKKNKLTISQNCKKYIKIPILVINQTCNNNQRYFILCPAKKKSSVLFQLLVRNGSIAIGLKEREKILKCSDFLCYPKDFPDSYGGILYNNFREQLAKNKYFKKPLRKRISYYCLGINNPFNYSWQCVYPYNSHIKIIRASDWYNQFLLKTFLHRFLSISLKRLCVLDTLDGFYNFIDEFKAKFAVFSTYFISVYVHAYREGTPERLSLVCSLTVEQLAKFFMKHGDTTKMTEWLLHRRTINRGRHRNKAEKLKEPISRRYKSKVMKRNQPPGLAKRNEQIYHLAEESDANRGEKRKGDEIILASRKIIGYVSSGGHVLSKGRGCGVAHISFLFLLENLLKHAFVLRLLAPDQIRINAQGREFPFLALIRNIDSVYYSHGTYGEAVRSGQKLLEAKRKKPLV